MELVGVFVNPTLDEVAHAAEALHLSHVQLHGDEGPVFCAEARRRSGCRVIKAIRVASAADLQDAQRFHTDFHLLDTAARGLRGGSGERWDWGLAERLRGDVPVILSGGLTAETVADGIAAVRPYAVDVASGVEAGPGRRRTRSGWPLPRGRGARPRAGRGGSAGREPATAAEAPSAVPS